LSPQQYSDYLFDIYGKGNFNLQDLWVIPDYKKFLHPCIDTKFGNYAKEENTQLCWRFEEVPVSVHSPMGVKTMYRAFANDVVYELVPDTDPDSQVGWKAARVYSSWGPLAKHSIYNSPVDGIHVMKRFPTAELTVAPFANRCHDTLNSTMHYMNDKGYFGAGKMFDRARADWDDFKEKFFPWNDNVHDYEAKHPKRFRNPLQSLVTLTYDQVFEAEGQAKADDDEVSVIPEFDDDEEDYAASAEAYLDSTLDIDATRLVTLNPAISNHIAGHSVRHGNNGQPLPVVPFRLQVPTGVNPATKNIDLAALRMTALLKPPTEDLTALTVAELQARLAVRGLPVSTLNKMKGKFDLVCL